MAENKALIGEVDQLWLEVEKASKDRSAQEEQMADLSWRLAKKDREKRSKTINYRSVLPL